MRNILFEHNELLLTSVGPPPPAAAPGPAGRRLLGITIALQLSGAPPPDAAGRLLLARYVAGRVSLAQILPLMW
jgi:hypothetical protein